MVFDIQESVLVAGFVSTIVAISFLPTSGSAPCLRPVLWPGALRDSMGLGLELKVDDS